MLLTTKDDFIEWVTEHKGLLFQELATPAGKQHWYVMPAGGIIVAIYNIAGELLTIGQPMVAPQAAPPSPFFNPGAGR